MSQEKLPSLPGTAPDGSWRIGTIDRDPADGRLAICAIVARPAASAVNLRGYVGGTLIGTGFFVIKDGGFATAKHVALEAQHSMSQARTIVLHVKCSLAMPGRMPGRPITISHYARHLDMPNRSTQTVIGRNATGFLQNCSFMQSPA